jgi:hypothetical protein
VDASYQSIHGPIAVRWEQQGGRFALEVSVPPRTSATVHLPAREGAAVLESGQPADAQRGVTHIGREDSRELYRIESGRYSFVSDI